ncbi:MULTISPECIES: vWA domain-containing protein [unclassified Haematobacter]|uniref:vWA domain-containing protein n=1 Tax=unclassified Haematobacter TaxID=2640585 RepID=UPI0025C38AE6|nr:MULTISPECIES: vWA domain-containing protein [unclassified Haematobacter]
MILVFLGLAALIVWLHAIRPERRVVPSLQIWLTLPERPGPARRRWTWPKLSTPLLLQLATLAALMLALGVLRFGPAPPAHLVMVLDASGPMAIADGDGTLFDRARAALAHDIAARRDAAPQRVSLILAGPSPRLLAARHGFEPEGLSPLIDTATVSDGPPDWSGVAELIRQTLLPGETVAGVIVTAFPPAALPRLEGSDMPEFRLLRIAADVPAPALDLRLGPADPEGWRLRGILRGAGPVARVTVDIGFTPQEDIGRRPPLPWKRLSLRPDDGIARIDETLGLMDPGLVTVTATAEGTVEWPGAEARFLTVPMPDRRVLYLAPADAPDQPLLRAMAAQEGLALYRAEALPPDTTGYALVIVDGMAIAEPSAAPTLWIGAAGIGTDEAPSVPVADADGWDPGHPLIRGVDWVARRFGQVSTRPLPVGADVLVSAEGHPLLAVVNEEPLPRIVMRFDPRNVDWGSGTDLPVLAGAMTDWLGLTGAARGTCTVGLPCAAGAGKFEPLGHGRGFTAATAMFPPAHAGLFRTPDGGLLAVNPAPDRYGQAAETTLPLLADASRNSPPIQWFLVAAAVLLFVEAALRLGRSGRRAMPGFIAPFLVGAGLIGLAVPLPFARSAIVHLLPEGGRAHDQEMSVATGPRPRIADPENAAGEPPAPAITHPMAAIALAAALVPPHQVADIRPATAVVSDGRPVPLPRHVHLATAPAAGPPPPGPVITALMLPATAVIGDRLVLTTLVRSDMQVPTSIAFLSNGTELAVEEVVLLPGMNRIETELPPLERGETRFGVVLGMEGGHSSRFAAIVTARAGRPIAILAPDAEHGAALARIAGAATPDLPADAGPELPVMDPAAAPDYLRGWLDYDAIVLVNLPARAVTSREAGLIEAAVTRHGLGLVMLGGANSFGPGGYFATAFETLSPLSARVPREAPEVTMVFVLDRSGSMNQTVAGGTRLEMARQATLEAIGLLNPESRVGVVVFDSEAHVVLPLTRAGDTATVRDALASVDTGGGTAIAPGLAAGWEMLHGSDAQARHMIVMTDGLSQPGDFEAAAAAMRAEGIIISAVAIGTGADAKAVREIAAAGGGSLHASDDFAALPSILSQEAMLLSSPVREGPGQPRPADPSDPLLRALPRRLPAIGGVVLTTAKPEARVALTTSTSDGEETPLLATWRQGNGQVLALATDATGPWTRNWQDDPDFSAFWPHVLRQIRPPRPATGPWLTLEDSGDRVRITLEALDAEGAPREGLAPLVRMDPEGHAPVFLHMPEVAAGIYRVDYVPEGTGRLGARVALPAAPGPQTAGRPEAEEVAEAALYLSRPAWDRPRAVLPLRTTGGAGAAPGGWGLRLVPGLSTPWVALALAAFIAALILYMRPPRRRTSATPTDATTRPEGIAP